MIKKTFNLIKRFVNKIIVFFKSLDSKRHLKKHKKEKVGKGDIVKVAFLVFEPETWDKQEPIYRELKERENVQVDVVVIPNFDVDFSVRKNYGKEIKFFESNCENVIHAYDDNGKLYDLKKAGYKYVFYEDLYNPHYPKKYNTYIVNKFAKICNIPYGFNGTPMFLECYNMDFFKDVYMAFAPSESVKNYLIKMFYKNYKNGIQLIEFLGYPALEKCWNSTLKIEDSILWTPRWSYDKKIGGSHFLEFKDEFVKLRTIYPKVRLILRPHPMMFTEFQNKGLMRKSDILDYMSELQDNNIELSSGGNINDDFERTEILITDYSSIILMFFLTGKPIIYCKCNLNFNEEYLRMIPGLYIAENWVDVKNYISEIRSGNDYLKNNREQIISEFINEHNHSAKKIVDFVLRN